MARKNRNLNGKIPKRVKNEPKQNWPIATIDFETDPFEYGRIPAPFCAGFYSLDIGFRCFWGADCVARLFDFLRALKRPHIIYAHNGGKFDFYFMLDELENPLRIINSRIAQVKIGKHELRDSYCILPIPLRAYMKDDIEYSKLEADVRETHKEEIISYLKTDCIGLFEIVFKFIERFGLKLTIGSTAIGILSEMHPFKKQGELHDEKFRPFYFGGRVEALKTGTHAGKWRVYDVNSMYPDVMRNCEHPTGTKYKVGYGRSIDKRGRIAGFLDAKFYFAQITCNQNGAFPTRQKDGPLNFDIPEGEFFVTSHELKAALETGRAWGVKCVKCWIPEQTINFADYVDRFMAEKIEAKASKNKAAEIFAKLLLNSAYGKFGSNPRAYHDYFLGDPPEPEKYEIYAAGAGRETIYRKPVERLSFYDVATAASITGAARAKLMRALDCAVNPVYCDTDSIICEALNAPLDESALGAWKLEAEGDQITVIGKKVYALRSGSEYVKTASKGVVLTGEEIEGLAEGRSVEWENMAPSFSLGKRGTTFVKRTIKSLQG